MTFKDLIIKTKEFVKLSLKDAEGGHDWFHIERVYKNALTIAKYETVDILVVSLASLLHDIADSKFYDGDETIGPNMARNFLFKQNVDSAIIEHVVKIVEHISYSKSLDAKEQFNSKELQVVQDADRLDAIGAIGIARCFNYGGFKNRKLYDPDIKPNPNQSKEAYKNSTAPTINHFYEKLLLLKDKMNTKSGKQIAEKRHEFMVAYLDKFYREWEGTE